MCAGFIIALTRKFGDIGSVANSAKDDIVSMYWVMSSLHNKEHRQKNLDTSQSKALTMEIRRKPTSKNRSNYFKSRSKSGSKKNIIDIIIIIKDTQKDTIEFERGMKQLSVKENSKPTKILPLQLKVI